MTSARNDTFEQLLAEAESQPLDGWDFSWLGSRMTTSTLPWDYASIVVAHARQSPDLLDMGTGGGEWLSRLPYRPPRTVATEAWAPNVEIAGRQLQPLGVTVVWVEGAPDNVDQRENEQRGQLPFPPDSFQLVVNRHEAFVAREVARVLVRGGRFVTQQVAGGSLDFCHLLGQPSPSSPTREWSLSLAAAQLDAAGLAVVDSGEGERVVSFADVGAIAWYLRAAPWTVSDFSIETHRPHLRDLHQRIASNGPVAVAQHAFWLDSEKALPT